MRRACRVAGISDSVYRYKPDKWRDEQVIVALQLASERYPAYGFSKLLKVLGRQGHVWNHKRVYRVYCELKLNMRRKGKKRLPNRSPTSERASSHKPVLVNGFYVRCINVRSALQNV